MKTPLSYQVTPNDSAPVAIINALSNLYEREELDSYLIEGIYTLSYNLLVSKESNGTEGICHISRFLESEMKGRGLAVKYLCSHEVFLGPGCSLYRTLDNGGKAVAKIFSKVGVRYITITSLTNDYLYYFDPYYGTECGEDIEILTHMPFLANKRIKMPNLSQVASDHVKGIKQEEKELVLFERVKQ